MVQNATSAKKLGYKVGDPYKADYKLSQNTGKVQYVTLHNTEDTNVSDDAAQYILATEYQNMGETRVHFYVDERSIWQNLKAGLGLCANDPVGSAEVAWHAGDGAGGTPGTGNAESLAIELVMNESATSDAKAKDNAARLCALLLYKHNLGLDKLVTHTYWVNKKFSKTKFTDVDEQCTTMVPGKKWCPCYLFASTNHATALKNWKAFKALVKTYLDSINAGNPVETESSTKPATCTSGEVMYRVQVGAFKVKTNATNYLKKIQDAGFPDAFIATDTTTTGTMYRVQVGAFRVKANADNYLTKVKAAGFSDAYVANVKASSSTTKQPTKSVNEIAKEVILGKWGNGQTRINKLKAAGYDPKVVQAEVNRLLK